MYGSHIWVVMGSFLKNDKCALLDEKFNVKIQVYKVHKLKKIHIILF